MSPYPTHLPRSPGITLLRPHLRPVEYRRVFDAVCPDVLHLEYRELKADNTPHNDDWFPVSDAALLFMQRIEGGTNVLDTLKRWTPPVA